MIRRWLPNRRSIALRLMGLAVVMVVGSLILSGIILQALFVANLEASVKRDLEAAMTRLIAVIDPSTSTPSISAPLPDPRYETPLGGRYWQIEALDTKGVARSRSLFDQQLDVAPQANGSIVHWTNKDRFHLILLSRDITIDGRPYRVTLGEDHDPIHQASQAYGWDIGRLFALMAIAIVGASWAQLQLGLAPLNRLRSAVDDVRLGSVGRLEGAFPSEIEPLVSEVNALLSEREELAQRGRRRASDLAHGLKTPLAALHGIAMRLRDKGQGDEATVLDDLAHEMSTRVDYQMRLASLRTRTGEHRESSSLNTAVLRTVAVLRKTQDGENLHWMAQLGDDPDVDIHRQDLMELIGVTLENASKWAHASIAVSTATAGAMALLTIEDDGPGIPDELIKKLGGRGMRLDQNVPGTGLGLAIAGEILDINGGAIAYSAGERGGLKVEVRLPLARR
ncbi:HAMP domain-containing histidine kinase [Devosia sp. BK]|uniref:sensor histidine kinase n=1 Tax=Devosia sp. BK TaxID=2871706 RepID=UPI00293B780E|nr:HAMP domain-containing sensor histidine kinase [Devosia sp. BK]MDV3251614.1 HAMP domain-containing histidine kinase [Devosia sp. BK]